MKAVCNGLWEPGDSGYSELYLMSLNRIVDLAAINSIKVVFKG